MSTTEPNIIIASLDGDETFTDVDLFIEYIKEHPKNEPHDVIYVGHVPDLPGIEINEDYVQRFRIKVFDDRPCPRLCVVRDILTQRNLFWMIDIVDIYEKYESYDQDPFFQDYESYDQYKFFFRILPRMWKDDSSTTAAATDSDSD